MPFRATSQVLIQGITGHLSQLQTPSIVAYGTQVVAGVSPGHGGENFRLTDERSIPVFDRVGDVVDRLGGMDVSLVFVPADAVLDAGLEAIAAGIRQVILLAEGVPPLDMVRLLRVAEQTDTVIIGPNSPGVIVPGQVLLGIHPPHLYQPGNIGILSRSGTLTFEVAACLTRAGWGQSICIGIGGDPIIGSSFPQWLQFLEEHEPTQAIVLVGEIGGSAEEEAAHYIAEAIDKPVVAYIAGVTAPEGKRMGHAGAVINPTEGWQQAHPQLWRDSPTFWDAGRACGSAQHKIAALELAQVAIAERPSQIPELLEWLVPRHN
ncbi:MAG: CoA-binding protein [Cyanobacteriota bacterium]|nr:CoA-binding protein [Cyanobacteriota bacterium]